MTNLEVYRKQLEGQLLCKIFNETIEDEWGVKTPVKIAVLLKYYLVSQGSSNEEAISNLNDIISCTLYANDYYQQSAFYGLKPAPKQYTDREAIMEFIADPFNDPGNL